MHEMELYPVREVVGREYRKAAGSEYIHRTVLRRKAKRRAKARTCFRAVGGVSWIAGLLVIAVTAAGIEQDMSGWQLVVMAAVGLGLLGLTAIASQRREEDV